MKENKLQTVGAVAGYILSGGRNTRMEGQKKLFLRYAGETFCQRILHACDCLPAVYLSVDNKEPYRKAGLAHGRGPVEGNRAAWRPCLRTSDMQRRRAFCDGLRHADDGAANRRADAGDV